MNLYDLHKRGVCRRYVGMKFKWISGDKVGTLMYVFGQGYGISFSENTVHLLDDMLESVLKDCELYAE